MFSERTMYELKTICMMHEIEYPKNAKKAELVKIIEDSGFTYEEYEKELEGMNFVKEPEVKVEEPVIVNEKEEVKTIVDEKVLLKMIHPRGAYNAGNGIIFTIDEPFKSFPRRQADEVLARTKNEVREATPEEAAFFYGVKL